MANRSRGRAYNDGRPLAQQTYPCPEPGKSPAGSVTTATVEAAWDSTTSVNGVYDIVAEAVSCDPNDPSAIAERVPVYVDNPAVPAHDVRVAVASDIVSIGWQWTGPDDEAGFDVQRAETTSQDWQTIAHADATQTDDRPGPGTYWYRVVALRQRSQGADVINAVPSAPSGAVTVAARPRPAAAAPPPALPLPPLPSQETGAPPPLALPPEAQGEAGEAPPTTAAGTYEEALPVGATPPTVAPGEPLEAGVGDPQAEAEPRDVVVRRFTPGKVIDSRLGMLGLGFLLVVASYHVAAFLRRTAREAGGV